MIKNLIHINKRPLIIAASVIALNACGGGGSSPTPPPTPPVVTPTIPLVLQTPDDAGYAGRKTAAAAQPEYSGSWTNNEDVVSGDKYWLGMIKADAAYARGATGAGESVVIVDSGIRASHNEFSDGNGSKVTVVPVAGGCSASDAAAGSCAGDYHGTAVASIVAANRDGIANPNGVNFHGVAFDADITFVPISLRGSNPNQPPSTHLNSFEFIPSIRSSFDDAADYRTYIAQGDILNFSFGRPYSLSEWRQLGSNCGAINESGPYACYKYYHRPNFTALAQANTLAADRSIVVIAAGNDNGANYDLNIFRDGQGPAIDATSPSASGAYSVAFNGAGDADLSHVLNVVALDATGGIASYSNRCGLAKENCIRARLRHFIRGFFWRS